MSVQLQTQISAPQTSVEASAGRLLQRKCACGGGASGLTGECEQCAANSLQRKRAVGARSDFLEPAATRLHEIARDGVQGTGTPVPFQSEIQPLMPGLDLSTVRAHTGSATDVALRALGANAYATGRDLGLPAHASQHLVAHELAHVAQQRAGVSLNGGIGREGDAYEVAADAIADRVASGRSAAEFMPAAAASMPQRPGRLQLDIWAPRSQQELNEEAVHLAEQQAKRRLFWDEMENVPDFALHLLLGSEKFRNKLAALDVEWRDGTFYRKSYVDVMEQEVLANAEAQAIYKKTLWDGTENRPVEKSWFDDAIGFICRNTNPCKGNMEQFRADRESGMSREEAIQRGMSRIALFGIEQGIGLLPQGSSGSTGGGPFARPPFAEPEPVPATGGRPPIALRDTTTKPTGLPIPIPLPTGKPARPAPTPTPEVESAPTAKPARPAPTPTIDVKPTPTAKAKPSTPTSPSSPVPLPQAPQPVPSPQPAPRAPQSDPQPPDEDRKRGKRCATQWVPRIEDTWSQGYHNEFARQMVTELRIAAPPDLEFRVYRGRAADSLDYDSHDLVSQDFYEFKTRYPYLPYEPVAATWFAASGMVAQAKDQKATMRMCGYTSELVWVFDNEDVANAARPYLKGSDAADSVIAARRPRRRTP